MGDRTYNQLTLPTTLRPRTLRAAAAAFTGDPWTKRQAKQELGEHLHLNPAAVCLTIEERLVGECRDAADAVRDALHDRGVDVPFAVIEDPPTNGWAPCAATTPSTACTRWTATPPAPHS